MKAGRDDKDAGSGEQRIDDGAQPVMTAIQAFVGEKSLTRTKSFSILKLWALEVAKRRSMMRAKVALARKLA